jgi:hypothetical protein
MGEAGPSRRMCSRTSPLSEAARGHRRATRLADSFAGGCSPARGRRLSVTRSSAGHRRQTLCAPKRPTYFRSAESLWSGVLSKCAMDRCVSPVSATTSTCVVPPSAAAPRRLPRFRVLGLRCSRRRRLREPMDQRVERLGGDAHLYQPAHSTGRGRPPRSETCPRPGGEPKVVARASSGTADREARAIAYGSRRQPPESWP